MGEAAPGLSTGHLGAHLVRHLLFEPLTGNDFTAFSAVLGRVRDHMRAAPPRSAMPRARRNQAG